MPFNELDENGTMGRKLEVALYCIIDTETTGFKNPRRIVEITWLIGDEQGEVRVERTFLIRPQGFVIPPDAARVHGITTERALSHGVELDSVLRTMAEDIENFKPQLVVAHNTDYDLPIVHEEYERVKIKNPLSQIASLCTMMGTVEITKIPKKSGNGFKWAKLQELHTFFFGLGFGDAHFSASDVRATYRCFVEFKKRFPKEVERNIRMPSPPETFLYVFECNKDTEDECVNQRIFGSSEKWVLGTRGGEKCVLYNYETQLFVGLFQIIESGFQIEPLRWSGRFPYQATVTQLKKCYIERFQWLNGKIPNIVKGHVAKHLLFVYTELDTISKLKHVGYFERLEKRLVFECPHCSKILKTRMEPEDLFAPTYTKKLSCSSCENELSIDQVYSSLINFRFNNKIEKNIDEVWTNIHMRKIIDIIFGKK